MDMTSKPSSALSPIVIATATICIVLIGEFIMVSRGSVLFTGRVPPRINPAERTIFSAASRYGSSARHGLAARGSAEGPRYALDGRSPRRIEGRLGGRRPAGDFD